MGGIAKETWRSLLYFWRKTMKQIFDSICLGIWIFELCYGIACAAADRDIPPIIFIMAVLVCAIHYIAEILKG